VIFED